MSFLARDPFLHHLCDYASIAEPERGPPGGSGVQSLKLAQLCLDVRSCYVTNRTPQRRDSDSS